jgi:hypothetical protein
MSINNFALLVIDIDLDAFRFLFHNTQFIYNLVITFIDNTFINFATFKLNGKLTKESILVRFALELFHYIIEFISFGLNLLES